MFSVRIVKVDHYLTPPKKGLDECYSEFRGCQLSRVPVVRIFGPTPSGQKVCVHLHGVYPYVCVPYDGTTLPVERYMYQLAIGLERALAATGHQSRGAEEVGATGVEHVHKVELVFGTPFYGYHTNEQQFLKIYFLNPQFIDRAVELLQSGAIMNRSFQPHEAHIPYTLQMFIDYNLHGMNLIKFRKVTFRENKIRSISGSGKETERSTCSYVLFGSGSSSSSSLSGHVWDPGSLPSHMITDDNVLKTSNCELEVDAFAIDILNSSEVLGTRMNPGIAAIWEDERRRKLEVGETFNLTPPLSQDRPFAMSTKSELFFMEKMKNKLASSRGNPEIRSNTSQAHENSGKEVEGMEVKLGTLDASMRLSQVSLNADDHEILDLLMNMADVQSDSGDSPPSPEDNKVDENDNRTMSQVVWDVDSDVEPSPNDDSDNDSGFLRSPEDQIFLQLDGANDPLDAPRETRASGALSAQRRSNSAKSRELTLATKSGNVLNGRNGSRNVVVTDSRELVTIRPCCVVLERLVLPPAKQTSCEGRQCLQEVATSCRRSRRRRPEKQREPTETNDVVRSIRDVERRRTEIDFHKRISSDLSEIVPVPCSSFAGAASVESKSILSEGQNDSSISQLCHAIEEEYVIEKEIEEAEENQRGIERKIKKEKEVQNEAKKKAKEVKETEIQKREEKIQTEKEKLLKVKEEKMEKEKMKKEKEEKMQEKIQKEKEEKRKVKEEEEKKKVKEEEEREKNAQKEIEDKDRVKSKDEELQKEIQMKEANSDNDQKMVNSPIALSSEPNSQASSTANTEVFICCVDLDDPCATNDAPVPTSEWAAGFENVTTPRTLNAPIVPSSASNSQAGSATDTVLCTCSPGLERRSERKDSSLGLYSQRMNDTLLDAELSGASMTETLKNNISDAICAADSVGPQGNGASELDASSKNDGVDKAKTELLALRRYRLKRISPLLEIRQEETCAVIPACPAEESSSSLVSSVADAKDRVVQHSNSINDVTYISVRGMVVKMYSWPTDAALAQLGKEVVVIKRLEILGVKATSSSKDSSASRPLQINSSSEAVSKNAVVHSDEMCSDKSRCVMPVTAATDTENREMEVPIVAFHRKSEIICRTGDAVSSDKSPQDIVPEPSQKSAELETAATKSQCKKLTSRKRRTSKSATLLKNLPEIGESDEAPEVVAVAKPSVLPCSKSVPVVRLERLNRKTVEKYSPTPEITSNARRRKLQKLLLYKGSANGWSCRLLRRKSRKTRRLSEYPLIHSAPPLGNHPTCSSWIDVPVVTCHSDPHSSVFSDNQFPTISRECLYSASIGIKPRRSSAAAVHESLSCLASPSVGCCDDLWSPASVCLSESNFQTTNEPEEIEDACCENVGVSVAPPHSDFEDAMWKMSFLSPDSRNSDRPSPPLALCVSPTEEIDDSCSAARVTSHRISEENPDFLFYGGADVDEDTCRRVLGLPSKSNNANLIDNDVAVSRDKRDENQIEIQRNGSDPETEFAILDNSQYPPSGLVIRDVPVDVCEALMESSLYCTSSASLLNVECHRVNSVDDDVFDETENMSGISQFDLPCGQPRNTDDAESPPIVRRRSCVCSVEDNVSSISPDLFSPPASVGSHFPALTSFDIHFDDKASGSSCETEERDVIPPFMDCDLAKSSCCEPRKNTETLLGLVTSLEATNCQIPHEPSESLNLEFESAADLLVDKFVAEDDSQMSDILFLDSADVDMNLEELKCTLDRVAPSSGDGVGLPEYFSPTPPEKNNERKRRVSSTPSLNLACTPIQSFYTYGSPSDASGQKSTSFNPSSRESIQGSDNKIVLTYGMEAPHPSAIRETSAKYGIAEASYQRVFCSDPRDVPDRPMEFGEGALVVRLRSNADGQLPEFASNFAETGLEHWRQVYLIAQESGYVLGDAALNSKVGCHRLDRRNFWEPSRLPPNPSDVNFWLDSKQRLVNGMPSGRHATTEKQEQVTAKSLVANQKALGGAFQGDVSPILPLNRNNDGGSTSKIGAIVVYHSTPGDAIVGSRRHKKRSVDVFDESVSPRRMDDTSADSATVSKRRKRSGRRLSFAVVETPAISMRKKTLLLQKAKALSPIAEKPQTSQLDGPTPKNACGFKISVDSLQETESVHHYQCVTLMSLELHVETVGDLRPDPASNRIRAIFYHIQHDVPEKRVQRAQVTGIIVVSNVPTPSDSKTEMAGSDGVSVGRSELLGDATSLTNVRDEFELMHELSNVVRHHDPDFLVGYEVQMLSWGFLLERALVLGVKLWSTISRVPDDLQNSFRPVQKSGDGYHVNIVGRTVFSLWQLMRYELPLYNYTFENVAYHVLHVRIPLFSFRTLSRWFDDDDEHPARRLNRWRTIHHYIVRAEGNVKIMEQLNLVGRTGELARLFGIQFWEVHSRGTQFRVESIMLRLCRQAKYVAVSPSVQQRSAMRAPEHVPLIMEPLSRFYTHPVVVLDFQSLYPSVIIAYNYCFSTCLGKIENLAEVNAFHFGCTSLKVPAGLMVGLQDRVNVSPCGVAFVKQDVRKGILPRMLEEILSTRVMVKMAMKRNKHNKALTRMLDARQLGLKLIANVTYGYTSANFSGRMPCVEVADSVVSKARETLERAIHLIEDTTKWGAKVVYGDTDSVFVLLEGRSKETAFAIGQEIVDAVTAANPKPIKLKLEKVYLPCVLQTKKRYVGFMYETPEQKEPVYDAKGIETVRRDGCPAVAKILEKSLRTLFRTHDVSQVRSYVVHQFQKLMSGRASVQDYVFTREYRGRHGYARPETPAPALRLARQFLRRDPRAEPRPQERVPYVIVYGSPGSLLIDLVRHPDDVLRDPSLRLNAKYYINNIVIPPLDRVFSLVGANVRHWYTFMARNTRLPLPTVDARRRDTLSRFLVSNDCPICSKPMTRATMCDACTADPQMAAIVLTDRMRQWERRYDHLSKVCRNCTGTLDLRMNCVSLDCPVRFRLVQALRDLGQGPYLREMLNGGDQLQW